MYWCTPPYPNSLLVYFYSCGYYLCMEYGSPSVHICFSSSRLGVKLDSQVPLVIVWWLEHIGSIWWFPEVGIPPNHPCSGDFPWKPWNQHKTSKFWSNFWKTLWNASFQSFADVVAIPIHGGKTPTPSVKTWSSLWRQRICFCFKPTNPNKQMGIYLSKQVESGYLSIKYAKKMMYIKSHGTWAKS